MPDLWVDVDTAVVVPVNIMPLIDDTDFKTIETAVVYNSAGMALTWNFVTSAGTVTGTAVTPTTAGDYDWAEPVADKGMYTIEIPASGGVSINNNTEGVGWFTGVATGVLPWRGPTIGFRRAALNDLFIDGSTASTNLEDFFDGTGYAGGTAKLTVDVTKWLGTAPATPTVAGVPEVDLTHVAGVTTNVAALATNVDAILTDTAVIGAAGAGLTAVPWNAAWDAEVQSEVDDALVAQRLDELLNADSDIDGVAPPTVGSVFHELLTKTAGSFTYDQTTDSLEAVRDRGDAAWITATGFATAAVCTEARLAELDAANLPATTDEILTDTAVIGAAGAGLTAVPWNASWDAEVQSEVDDALVAQNLDHLVGTATAIPAVVAGTYIDQMMDDGTAVYDRTTDSLQAIRDTAPLGTAMRGTDSAALASVCTEARLAELDAANLPAVTDAILVDTGTTLDAALAVVDANVDAILVDTADMQPKLGTPAGTDMSADIAAVKVDTAAILVDTGTTLDGRIPAALVGGRMDSDIGAKTGNVALSTQEKADVNAEVVDAVATDTYAEPGQGTPAATTTLAAKLNYLYKAWRNRVTQTATQYTLYADNATTVDQKAAVSDDATTFDKGEVATGP